MSEKRSWIEVGDAQLSVRRQCELLGLHRSNLYAEAVPESAENVALMRLVDEEYLRHPFLGSRRMEVYLEGLGQVIRRKKVRLKLPRACLHPPFGRRRPLLAADGHRRARSGTAHISAFEGSQDLSVLAA